jgi:hypothetical protein
VRWEREDAAYGAATLVAAALVAYFAIGNFGLVPSPLAPRGAGGVRPIDVPSLAVAGVRPTASVTVVPPVAAGTAVPAASPAPRPAAADRTPPTAEISTPGGTQASVAEPGTVDGTADDAGVGVRDVTVTFAPQSGDPPTVVPARMRCANGSRRSCQWSADVPGVAGSYRVTAVAADRASNKGHAGPTDVTVVNTGSVVGDVTDLLGGVVGAVAGRR